MERAAIVVWERERSGMGDLFSVEGKTAVVTGGAGGSG